MKKDHTWISTEVPNEILKGANAKRGDEALNTLVCRLLAEYAGLDYTPPTRGRPRNEASAD